jgi:hypothetical protein
MRGISCLDVNRLASEEGLCSMDGVVIIYYNYCIAYRDKLYLHCSLYFD